MGADCWVTGGDDCVAGGDEADCGAEDGPCNPSAPALASAGIRAVLLACLDREPVRGTTVLLAP